MMMIISIMTTLLERNLLVRLNLNATRDHYLSTTILAISTFLFFLFYVPPAKNFISKIGQYDTTEIYIIHPIVLQIFDIIMEKMPVGSYNKAP